MDVREVVTIRPEATGERLRCVVRVDPDSREARIVRALDGGDLAALSEREAHLVELRATRRAVDRCGGG